MEKPLQLIWPRLESLKVIAVQTKTYLTMILSSNVALKWCLSTFFLIWMKTLEMMNNDEDDEYRDVDKEPIDFIGFGEEVDSSMHDIEYRRDRTKVKPHPLVKLVKVTLS